MPINVVAIIFISVMCLHFNAWSFFIKTLLICSRSRGSKDEGTNDFLIQMKKRLKSVQHKSQEDVRYEQKHTAVDRKKVKSEIFFDQTVPGEYSCFWWKSKRSIRNLFFFVCK